MKNAITFVLRLVIVAILILDGGSKLDNSIEAVAFMPLTDIGAPNWAIFIFGILELAFGLLTFFGALPFFLSMGICAFMLAYTGMLQTMGGFSITALTLDNLISTITFSISTNPQSTALLLALFALVYGLLSRSRQQEMIAKRKEKRASKKVASTRTAVS